MSEIAANPQLDIWRLEGEIERCTDPAQREALVRRRLNAQREFAAEPPFVTVGDRMPRLPGIDINAMLAALRAMPPQERRAHDEAIARGDEEKRQRNLAGDEEKRQRARRAALSTIPKLLLPLALDPSGLRRTAALAAVQGLQSGLVVLTGPHNASKSQSAGAALAPRGLFIKSPTILGPWMRPREKAAGALCREDLLEVPRLVIDEVGRELGTREQRLLAAEAVVALSHLRSEEGHLTILTSNCDRGGLREALTISRTSTPALERWSLFRERLKGHGRTAATTAEIEKLGGRVPWPGFVECPYEGFRRGQP